ncbi:MAG: SurA N-terminal domain-containing protein [Pseudomarimonas sp.]
MLQKLREKTSGWVAFVIIGILVVPFAFFGVTDYFSAPAETWVAKVGETEISQQEFQRRFEEYRAQMRQMLGDRYDGAMLERPETRQALLDRLVDEELLRQSLSMQGAIIAPATLAKEIAAIPAFHVEGKFSPDQYRLLLAGQNMSPREFERRMLRDLEVRALPEQIESTAFATVADVDAYLALRDQRRDLRFLVLDPPELGNEPLDEAELIEFHTRNSDRYLTEELVSIEYLLLDSAKLEVPAVADDATLQQRYDEGKSRFVEPEQRLASHILIKTAVDADADAQRVAQEKAQALVVQARADDADFAALAREHSEDAGSKTAGGDLGWLERGLTDPAFETALFGLAVNSISDPIKSAEGWHVIQLRELRAEKRKQFADVRAELQREFLETERERRFSDMSGKMVDAIYRDPTTLQTAAKELGLEIQKLGPFSRLGGADPISSNPKVIELAFSPAVLTEQNVSEPVDIGDNRYFALKVVDHKPAVPIPLADIRVQVEAELRQEKRANQASAKAKALFDRLNSGESLAAIAAELSLEVQEALDVGRTGVAVDAAISTAAFALQHPGKDAVASSQVALGGDRHALLQVIAIRPGKVGDTEGEQRVALRDQLAQAFGAAEAQAYTAALRKQIPVELAPERM